MLTGFFPKRKITRVIELDPKPSAAISEVSEELLFATGIGKNPAENKMSISGRVLRAADGSGIPGVNIILKGTGTGTSSDSDGFLTLEVSGNKPILVFTHIGKKSYELVVAEQVFLLVEMESAQLEFDDITRKGEIEIRLTAERSKEFGIHYRINKPVKMDHVANLFEEIGRTKSNSFKKTV